MRPLPPLRAARPLTAVGLCAAAFALAAPGAFAGDFGEVEASPRPARAGAGVSLVTRDCGHSRSATVDAGALGGGIVTLRPGARKGVLVGEVRVGPDTRPGNYGLGGRCADGKALTGTVSTGTDAGVDTGAGTGRDGARGPTPGGGVRTGAPANRAGAAEESAGTAEVLAGASLMLAVAAGGSWVLRRRHAGRRG